MGFPQQKLIIGIVCDVAIYFITIETFSVPTSVNLYKEFILPMLLVQLGAAVSVLLTTLVMRFCGFRMIRMPKAAVPAVEP